MNISRAKNLYLHLRNIKTPQVEINALMKLLKERHDIDLCKFDRVWKRNNIRVNQFDINTYGKSGSRTMRDTKTIGKTIGKTMLG